MTVVDNKIMLKCYKKNLKCYEYLFNIILSTHLHTEDDKTQNIDFDIHVICLCLISICPKPWLNDTTTPVVKRTITVPGGTPFERPSHLEQSHDNEN